MGGAMSLEAESGRTRTVSVIDDLRAAILSGRYEPGERLQETRLGAHLGVSRTPIRLALQTLATEGLLEHIPNCGYSVRIFDKAEILQAFEARAAVEGLAARFAAERGISIDDQIRFEKVLSDGDKLLAGGDPSEGDRRAYTDINASFHALIHECAAARVLDEMLRLTRRIPGSPQEGLFAFEYGKIRHRHDEHHRVFEAIIRRDGRRAEEIMREHVASIKTGLMRLSDSYRRETA